MLPEAHHSSLHLSLVLYLGTLGLVLTLLVVVYVYLITHQSRANAWIALERWLARRLPHLWSTLRSTLSRTGRRRLGAAGVVVAFSLLGYGFGVVTVSWRRHGNLFRIDQLVYGELVATSEPGIEHAMTRITQLGALELVVPVSLMMLAVFLKFKQRLRALAVFLIMGLGQGLVWGLKLIFARERPSETLVHAAGAAFPSGHAFTAVTLYGFFIYLVWSHAEHPIWRSLLTALLGTVAVLVAVSRILLRVHWFSDVVGGFMLGFGWLICCLLAVHVLRRPKHQNAAETATVGGFR